IQGGNAYNEDWAYNPDVDGYAFGLAQWDSDRRVNLLNQADSEGVDWQNLEFQLNFLLNHDGSDSTLVKSILESGESDMTTLVERFATEWERAGEPETAKRVGYANHWYSQFGDGSGGNSNIDNSNDSGSDNRGSDDNCATGGYDGAGEMGKSVSPNGKNGSIVTQWESRSEIPEEYSELITVPEFDESWFSGPDSNGSNPFLPVWRGQCTELTWGYMSQLWDGEQPTNGHGRNIYQAYEAAGADMTYSPTVGYGYSSEAGYGGATDPTYGHTAVVVAVLDDGRFIAAHYNLNGEGNDGRNRNKVYALHDGAPGDDNMIFFSGIGEPTVDLTE